MTTGTELVQYPPVFDDDQLAAIDSYDAALKLLDAASIPPETIADYGTGFAVVDKATLIAVPLVLLQWRFNEGDYDGNFVSVEAVTKHGEKVIFNDGSTGIRRQLETVTAQRIERGHPSPQAGLVIAGGLSKNDYFYNAETGESSTKAREGKDWAPASTYYLAD